MRAVFAVGLLALCATAQAEFKDGNKLYSDLTGNHGAQMLALGYITGVADALGGVTHCAPANVTAGQIFDMTKQYLEENPSLRHFTADLIVSRVLGRTWPCPKKGNAL